MRLFIPAILLFTVLLSGCGTFSSPVTESSVKGYIKQRGVADANIRFEKMYSKKIDTGKEGRWEISSINSNEAYVSYISPLVLQNKREVYMVLEYNSNSQHPWAFICYKFFNKGEDYNNNHH